MHLKELEDPKFNSSHCLDGAHDTLEATADKLNRFGPIHTLLIRLA